MAKKKSVFFSDGELAKIDKRDKVDKKKLTKLDKQLEGTLYGIPLGKKGKKIWS